MVSSINPGATSAGALGADPRYTRPAPQSGLQRGGEANAGDRVDVSGAAAWAAARESVGAGLAQLQQALSVGRDAQTTLVQVQALADPNATQVQLNDLLQGYAARYGAAAGQGASLIGGQDLSVQAEPGGAALTISGADLALKAQPGADAVIQVASNASLSDRAALQQAAQTSLDRLQGVVDTLNDASRALGAHQGFLGAAQGAASTVTDLNADSARLLALQVRQGLESVGHSIANVEPQAVLALFKA
jgi:hypothetical protein